MKVIKRDGRKVAFDKSKIESAITKAFISIDGEISEYATDKARDIANQIEAINKDLNVEEIQDLVENKLMASNRKDIARVYILYRNDRNIERTRKSVLIKEVSKKISATNVENQNANVDEESFGGKKGEASNVLMKQYALDYCMSQMAKINHLNNEVYIHDLSEYPLGSHNCLTIPFDDLLAKGFDTRQTDVRPANSVNTAFQLVAVIFQLQSLQQFGGCSASHLDWTMVPYVRKSFRKHYCNAVRYIQCKDWKVIKPKDDWSIDCEEYKSIEPWYQYAMDMTVKEVHQAVEGMYHNLNTLQSRSGNQLPFTSINYGTCTLPEGRMITKALLEVSIEGIGALHRTSIFPCGIMVLKKGINRQPGDPNYDLFQLALRSTAQRLYPNYANGDVIMQNEWVEYDRKNKEEYLKTLSDDEYSKLIQIIEDNPNIANNLRLTVVDDNEMENDI